jgi:hypothetical protein
VLTERFPGLRLAVPPESLEREHSLLFNGFLTQSQVARNIPSNKSVIRAHRSIVSHRRPIDH